MGHTAKCQQKKPHDGPRPEPDAPLKVAGLFAECQTPQSCEAYAEAITSPTQGRGE